MFSEISYQAQVLKLKLLAKLVWLLWWYHDWCYRNAARHTGDTACSRDCLQAAQEMCSEVFELRMKRQSLGLLHAIDRLDGSLHMKQRSPLLRF